MRIRTIEITISVGSPAVCDRPRWPAGRAVGSQPAVRSGARNRWRCLASWGCCCAASSQAIPSSGRPWVSASTAARMARSGWPGGVLQQAAPALQGKIGLPGALGQLGQDFQGGRGAGVLLQVVQCGLGLAQPLVGLHQGLDEWQVVRACCAAGGAVPAPALCRRTDPGPGAARPARRTLSGSGGPRPASFPVRHPGAASTPTPVPAVRARPYRRVLLHGGLGDGPGVFQVAVFRNTS